MSCKDCFNNCGGAITSDKCVKYTGPDIDFLGIEQGDNLSMFEAAIVAQLETILNGTGITFEDLDPCQSVIDALGKGESNLANIVQAINDVLCNIQDEIDVINEKIKPVIFSFDTKCLPGLAGDATRDQILQATIDKVCALEATVKTVTDDYVTDTELCDKVKDCLTPKNTGTEVVQQNLRFPAFVALPYHGPLSNFDAGGAGLSAQGYDRIYICNGQTVGTFITPDYRGRSPIGANANVPGGTLDAAVDPSQLVNAGYTITPGSKKGEYTHTNTINETPAHIHTATATSHSHHTVGTGADSALTNQTPIKDGHSTGGNLGYSLSGAGGTASLGKTDDASTTVTIGSIGGGQPHNNTHPVLGCVFVIYIPV